MIREDGPTNRPPSAPPTHTLTDDKYERAARRFLAGIVRRGPLGGQHFPSPQRGQCLRGNGEPRVGMYPRRANPLVCIADLPQGLG